MPKQTFALLFLCFISAFSSGLSAQQPLQAGTDKSLKTVAEASDFSATANAIEVEVFMRRLATQWPGAELTTLGRTVEGRPIWAVVVEPTAASLAKPITVLMLGGIHSGECDGKEAILALGRDLCEEALAQPANSDPATNSDASVSVQQIDDAAAYWQTLRLILVPNFNADGNERRSPFHRPGQAGQAGPEDGMGIRENAQGLDLNRDFIKLESPEVRSLVAAINEYEVDILIDTHTTNGSLHRYELTYDIPHIPATPKPIDLWLRSRLIPVVTEQMAASGHAAFYYGNFEDKHRTWKTYGLEPRYSTEYMGLRGRIGILSESYSYASYETRINATYSFLNEILKVAAADAPAIRQMIETASSERPTLLPLSGELAKTADDVLLKGYQRADGSPPAPPFGPDSAAGLVPKTWPVQLWNRAQTTKEVLLPAAYVVPKQHAWAVGRLMRHGVQIKQLQLNVSTQAQTLRISDLQTGRSFQGHAMQSLTVNAEAAVVELEAGDFLIETAQPLGPLAAFLLEPESDDSLAKWNFFDPVLEVDAAYPVLRLMAPLPSEVSKSLAQMPTTEQITLDGLMRPGREVDYGASNSKSVSWLKDTDNYVVESRSGAMVVAAESGSQRSLTEIEQLRQSLANLAAFSDQDAREAAKVSRLSEDWTHALVEHKNDLYFFDSDQNVARKLTHSPESEERLAELSPSGELACFVRDNNLWMVDCNSTELKQLTADGSGELLNGVLDWVYQEELYGRGNFKGFWWNPESTHIAYLQLDQSPVKHYQVSDSISYSQTLEDTRYPKAGEPLPTARMWLLDVRTGQQREIDLSSFPADDRLIARVTWSPAGELWLQVLNRVQNQQDLVRVNVDTGLSKSILRESSPGWIEVRGTPVFLSSEKFNGDFLWLSDLPSGRTQLLRVTAEGETTRLTQGDWDVDRLLGATPGGEVAFVSGNISHPTENQLVAIDIASSNQRQITSAPGTHTFRVSKSGKYFIDTFSSLASPSYTSVHSIDGQLIRVIEAPVSDRFEALDIQVPELIEIPARDGLALQAMVMLPVGYGLSNTDPTSDNLAPRQSLTDNKVEKLPVIFHVYGGPQSPTVRNSWGGRNYWWHQMLCQQGFAVVLCDNRSALGRGVSDTWKIRGDLGRVELQDLEDAVAWVSNQPWADPERIGMWGWSYGGYFTSYAMTHSKLFKAGIAGAPVTDWHNYDAIYTERYMDLPQTNKAGYQSSSSVQAAENLHGQMLIIHGERDDNVHISNSLQLAYALQKAGKQFELMIYPKNRHGIVDKDQRYHMHRLMTDFFDRHLKSFTTIQ